MSDIRAIAVDVDGTLLTSQGRASTRTMQALRRCAEQGIVIYVATARPRRLVFREDEVHGDVRFLKGGGVFYNGAAAFDDAMSLYAHWPIPGSIVSGVVDIIEAHGNGIQIALQFEERSHSFCLPIDDATLLGWGFQRHELLSFAEARTSDCSKIVAFGEGSAPGRAYEQVLARFPNQLVVFRSDSGNWMQVMSREARKESALTYLLRSRGISAENVVVFGDDTADIGMLRTFKHSVAMGNASETVKAAATHVTATNDEHGIEYALHAHFGLI